MRANLLHGLSESVKLNRLRGASADDVKHAFCATYLTALALLRTQDLAGLERVNDPGRADLARFDEGMSDLNFWGRALFYPGDPQVRCRLRSGHAEALAEQVGMIHNNQVKRLLVVPLAAPHDVDWDAVTAGLLLLRERLKVKGSHLTRAVTALYGWAVLTEDQRRTAVDGCYAYLRLSDPRSELLEARSAWEDQQDSSPTFTVEWSYIYNILTKNPDYDNDDTDLDLSVSKLLKYCKEHDITVAKASKQDHVVFSGDKASLEKMIETQIFGSRDRIERWKSEITEARSAWEDQEETKAATLVLKLDTLSKDLVNHTGVSQLIRYCTHHGILIEKGMFVWTFSGKRQDLENLVKDHFYYVDEKLKLIKEGAHRSRIVGTKRLTEASAWEDQVDEDSIAIQRDWFTREQGFTNTDTITQYCKKHNIHLRVHPDIPDTDILTGSRQTLEKMIDDCWPDLTNPDLWKQQIKSSIAEDDGGGDAGGANADTTVTGNLASCPNAIVGGGYGRPIGRRTDTQSALNQAFTLSPTQVTKKGRRVFRDGKLVKKRVQKFKAVKFKAPEGWHKEKDDDA